MTTRPLASALALALCCAGTTALAQKNPPRFNNPNAQTGMYNGAGPLNFNNPMAQGGMYGGAGPLQFNNPMNQVGMYNGNPALRFNNPAFQGNQVPGGFNNPAFQGNFVPGGFNNPLNTPTGNGFNPLAPDLLNPTGKGFAVTPKAAASMLRTTPPGGRGYYRGGRGRYRRW